MSCSFFLLDEMEIVQKIEKNRVKEKEDEDTKDVRRKLREYIDRERNEKQR